MAAKQDFRCLIRGLDKAIAQFFQEGHASRDRVTRRAVRLTRLGWTYSAVMLVDRLKDGEMLRMNELAERTGTTPSTISKLSRDLEKQGLVHRTPDALDGRAGFVGLSERGRQVAAAIDRARLKALEEVMADWSEDDLQQLLALFARLQIDMQRLT